MKIFKSRSKNRSSSSKPPKQPGSGGKRDPKLKSSPPKPPTPSESTPAPSKGDHVDSSSRTSSQPSNNQPGPSDSQQNVSKEQFCADGSKETDHQPIESLWELAWNKLTEREQKVLQSYKDSVVKDPEVFDQLAKVVARRTQDLSESSWKFTFNGREIIVRDLINKVVVWLDRFKEIGDVAANFDPVHSALPWAAVRFILQAVILGQNLSGHLLVSTEQIAHLMVRIRIYQSLYLKPRQYRHFSSVRNLHSRILPACTKILSFLAYLVDLVDKNMVARSLHAVLKPSEFSSRLSDLESLRSQLESDAATCEMECSRQDEHLRNERHEALIRLLQQRILRSDVSVARFWKLKADEERGKILQWISDIPYIAVHDNAKKGRTDGTGQWLLDDAVYQDWRSASSSIQLWLHGIPGAGKTKLVTKVVDDLLELLSAEPNDEAIAYFYCDRNRTEHQNPVSILRNLIRQVAAPPCNSALVDCVVSKYEEKQRTGFASGSLTKEECGALLLQLVNIYPQTTLIIDGLDECDRSTRHILMDILDSTVTAADRPVKIFISSREDQDLTRRYEAGGKLRVTAARNQSDIEKFVRDRMQLSSYCTNYMQENVRNAVFRTFREKSQGMFQWAALHIDDLLDLERDTDVLQYLDQLPVGLKQAYDNIFEKIMAQRGSKKDIALAALKWVFCAARPLSPLELVIAVCQDPEKNFNKNVDVSVEYVFDACHNLIGVYANAQEDPIESEILRAPTHTESICLFSHLSVFEYLAAHHFNQVEIDTFAACVCLRTLLEFKISGKFIGPCETSSKALGDQKNTSSKTSQYPSMGSSNKPVGQEHSRRGKPASVSFHLSSLQSEIDLASYTNREAVHGLDSFFYSRSEFTGISKALWRNIRKRDLYNNSTIGWVSYTVVNCFRHIIRIPLDKNGQISKEYGFSTLLSRFFGDPIVPGDHFLAWIVLGCPFWRVGFNSVTWNDSSFGYIIRSPHPALACAILGAHHIIAKWLDDGDLDANFAINSESILYTAAKNGQTEVCQELLKAGSNPDGNCHYWETPLENAIRHAQNHIVLNLLGYGADTHRFSYRGPLLHQAASVASETTVKLLLAAGSGSVSKVKDRAPVGHPPCNMTPLEIACACPHPQAIDVVMELVKFSSEVNKFHPLALRLAAQTGKEKVIDLLLSLGADIEANLFEWQGEECTDTPLLSVVRSNLVPTPGFDLTDMRAAGSMTPKVRGALHLLKCGANPDVKDSSGSVPVMLAADNFDVRLVNILLKNGANPNSQHPDGTTICQIACRWGWVSTIRLLLNHGVDVNAVSGKWRTALYAAYQNVGWRKDYDPHGVIPLLLQAGAKFDQKDYQVEGEIYDGLDLLEFNITKYKSILADPSHSNKGLEGRFLLIHSLDN